MELVAQSVLDGKYRLVRELGRGGMGSVWQAEHLLTGREVAVKVVIETQQSPETKARMLREARACGRVADPHVVQILDAGQTDDGDPYLIMELLDGESLDARLAKAGKLPVDQAAAIGLGVARGLTAVHKLGVVHRDLKPANIFLHKGPSGDVVVKVVDFGISKVESANDLGKTDTGKVVGSPAYMSPEQAEGLPNIDQRTDVWSLGVVLYELLAGKLPFRGETPWAMVAEIMRGEPPDVAGQLSGVDERMVKLIERCLVRKRDDRLGTAAEVALVLSEIAGQVDRVPAAVTRSTGDVVDPHAATVEGKSGDIIRTSNRAAFATPSAAPSAPAPRRRTGLYVGGGVALTAIALWGWTANRGSSQSNAVGVSSAPLVSDVQPSSTTSGHAPQPTTGETASATAVAQAATATGSAPTEPSSSASPTGTVKAAKPRSPAAPTNKPGPAPSAPAVPAAPPTNQVGLPETAG